LICFISIKLSVKSEAIVTTLLVVPATLQVPAGKLILVPVAVHAIVPVEIVTELGNVT
jgi:hypothetical protein